MNLIAENPYRTLGVFSGASTREIQKQLAMVKAFSRVGKQSRLETDFEFLGGVNRDLDLITEAANKIEQAKNKILYSFFWFQKSNHIDETALSYLTKNETDKAVEIWNKLIDGSNNIVSNKSFSAYLNISTLFIGLGILNDDSEDIIKGLQYKGLLIASDQFNDFSKAVGGENIVLNREVIAGDIVNEVLALSKEEDISLSFAQMLEAFKTFPPKILDDLKKKYTEQPILSIEKEIELTKESREESPEEANVYGTNLYKNTKQDLQSLFQTLGKTNIEVKTLANNLAGEILQCSIDFFNYYHDDDDFNPGDESLKLAKMAKSICPQGATLNRINENIESIEDWVKNSEERRLINKIGSQAQYIVEKIKFASETLGRKGKYPRGYNDPYSKLPLNEQPHNKLPYQAHNKLLEGLDLDDDMFPPFGGINYQSPIDTLIGNKFNINLFYLSRDIVRHCKTKLDEIKVLAGENNKIYQNLSDQLANVGLACLISFVNNDGNPQLGIPPNIDDHVINSMTAIGALWMTSESRQRFETQKQSLFNLKRQIEKSKSSSKSSSGCYIATMVYGDYNHPKVMVLRNYRDEVLHEYYLGRQFIMFYYAVSPTLVKYLKNNNKINHAIRMILDRIISRILK